MLWMIVTADEYELPMAVGDSGSELARMIGYQPQTVCLLERCHWKSRGKINGTRFRVVKMEVDDE